MHPTSALLLLAAALPLTLAHPTKTNITLSLPFPNPALLCNNPLLHDSVTKLLSHFDEVAALAKKAKLSEFIDQHLPCPDGDESPLCLIKGQIEMALEKVDDMGGVKGKEEVVYETLVGFLGCGSEEEIAAVLA